MTENNNTTKKAVIAKVNLGFTVIDGLMLPNGSYAVGVSQIAELFQFDKNQASRYIKPILGDGFQFTKVASELQAKDFENYTPKQP